MAGHLKISTESVAYEMNKDHGSKRRKNRLTPNRKTTIQGTRGPLTKHTYIQSPSAFSKPNNKSFLVLYLPQ